MNKSYQIIKLIILCTLVILCISCRNSTSSGSFDREELFSLEIGPMEDQIALYSLDGTRGIKNGGFTMRDGQFYVSDGKSGKIVRYNSYGDILFMIYNEATNPVPRSLKTNVSEDEQVTRWAHTYPLEGLGWIAVDSRKHIFVEDRVPGSEQRFDSESRVLLDGLILHFDQNGRFINYLGREGIGGSPFPRIVGLSTSVRDELAVICRVPDGWEIYWFNSTGTLLYYVKVASNVIPALPDWPSALGIIDTISASVDSRRLYIKINYTNDTMDASTNTYTGSVSIGSYIWILNIEDGSYTDSVEIPLYEIVENGRPTNFKVFYTLLGVAKNGQTLFYFPTDEGLSLLFVNLNNREQRRGNIKFSDDELGFNDFFLSTEGILCAMMAEDFHVKFVWWRTDRMINSE